MTMRSLVPLTDHNTGRRLTTSAGEIYYNYAGEGPALLMLHGSGPGATGWSNFGNNMQDLSKHFRCIAPDMPGWGRSVAVQGKDRLHARDAIEMLDSLGVEKFAVVGNSMGGATAIRLAVDHPERVTHLLTMGAVAPGPRYFLPAGGPSEGLKQVYETYADPSPKSMRRLVEVFTFDSTFATPELIHERSQVARSRSDHLANFLADPNVRRLSATIDEVGEIEAPTLIMHGRDDRVIPYENALLLVSAIPDSRAVIVNRCGHWMMLEHPSEFNRLVREFILHG